MRLEGRPDVSAPTMRRRLVPFPKPRRLLVVQRARNYTPTALIPDLYLVGGPRPKVDADEFELAHQTRCRPPSPTIVVRQ